MTDYSLNDRWQENRSTWKAYWDTFTLDNFAIALIIFAVSIVGFGYFNQHGSAINWTNIFGDFYANVSSELISIVITVLVLERLNNRRQDKQELIRLKELLSSNEALVTKIAIAELKAKGWLYDGSLEEADLAEANLTEANMFGANFRKANFLDANLQDSLLIGANLTEANMFGANLERANLWGAKLKKTNLKESNLGKANLKEVDMNEANLQEANLKEVDLSEANLNKADLTLANMENTQLISANLQETDLSVSNLQGAILRHANLQNATLIGTSLEGADLTGANIDGIKWSFDDETYPATLPDGTEWSKNTDMKSFTKPSYPKYKDTFEKINEIRDKKGLETLWLSIPFLKNISFLEDIPF